MGVSTLCKAGASREDRRSERANFGRLSDRRVNDRTRNRYYSAVDGFMQWLRLWQLGHAATWEELEWQLMEYLETLWQEGESKGLANDTLSGVSLFLRTRRRYPGAWQLLTVWGRLEVPDRAPPLSADMALALAGWGVIQGRNDLSAAILAGFHMSLRVAEILDLSAQCITFGCDHHGGVSLPWTKTSQQRGARESISIDPLVGWLLGIAIRESASGKILQMSGPAFRVFFSKGIAALGLMAHGYRPYSLRRGGATHDLLTHQDLQRSVLRGRWGQLRTAKIYITDGAAIIQELKLTPAMNNSIAKFRGVLQSAWRSQNL